MCSLAAEIVVFLSSLPGKIHMKIAEELPQYVHMHARSYLGAADKKKNHNNPQLSTDYQSIS